MTTAVILGAALLFGVGLVASQLVRLKDWLARQPAVPDPAGADAPDQPDPDG